MSFFSKLFKKEPLQKPSTSPIPEAQEAKPPACVGDYLSKDTILITNKPGKKSQLLNQLVELIGKKNPHIPTKTAFQAVMEREKISSTFMENGVGVPHARLPKLGNIYASLAIVPSGLFESKAGNGTDAEPVTHFVFLFLSPQGEFNAHLQLLSKASYLFQMVSLREKLIKATSPQEALTLIQQIETSTP